MGLVRDGVVVAGAVIQANVELFTPGDDDLPASVLYSADAYYRRNWLELAGWAERLLNWKIGAGEPHPQEFNVVVDDLRRERLTFAQEMPVAAFGGRAVFHTTTMFHRRDLAERVLRPLAGTALAFLMLPDAPGVIRFVPSRYP
jgi:hypothetical protein